MRDSVGFRIGDSLARCRRNGALDTDFAVTDVKAFFTPVCGIDRLKRDGTRDTILRIASHHLRLMYWDEILHRV